MSAADRDRILDKIKKCFTLAKSSEAHEAAAALRQAQKLMAAYSVSEEEVLGMEVRSTVVVTPEPYKKKLPLYMNVLLSVCSKAFECDAIIECSYKNGKPRLTIRYFGLNGKDQLAAYAHEVMWRSMMASWNEFRVTRFDLYKTPGARMGFWVGWLQEVRSKIMEFAGNVEEKQMINRAMLAYAGMEEIPKAKNNDISLNGQTASAGRIAAEDFSIHRPMGGAAQAALPHLKK